MSLPHESATSGLRAVDDTIRRAATLLREYAQGLYASHAVGGVWGSDADHQKARHAECIEIADDLCEHAKELAA